MNNFINFGADGPRGTILSSLPFLENNNYQDFEISASQPDSFNYSMIAPFFVENIIVGESFSAILPKRKKVFVDNVVGDYAETDAVGLVKWNPAAPTGPAREIAHDAIAKSVGPDSRERLNRNTPGVIIGDEMEGEGVSEQAVFYTDNDIVNKSFDDPTLEDLIGHISSSLESASDEEEENFVPAEKKEIKVVNQSNPAFPIWWNLEGDITDLDLRRGAYLSVSRNTLGDFDGTPVLMWTFGTQDLNGCFSIIVRDNADSFIYDYKYKKYFNLGKEVIRNTDKDIEISYVSLTRRLLVIINDSVHVYSRVKHQNEDNATSLENRYENEPIEIAGGRHFLLGLNTSGKISLSPMDFATYGLISFRLPSSDREDALWKGIRPDGEYEGSVFDIYRNENIVESGVECSSVTGYFQGPIDAELEGGGEITVRFFKEDTYFMAFKSNKDELVPVFYRMKGGRVLEQSLSGGGGSANIDDFILSVTETCSTDDYHSVSVGVELSLYNPGGIFDGLIGRQHAIQLSWGDNLSFTGISVNTDSVYEPGNETLKVRYEDSMYILKSQPIIHNIAFDGMWDYAAMDLLAKFAGFIGIKLVREGIDYFLPSGTSYNNPLYRFPGEKPILDCMIDIAKNFEGYIYADEDGAIVYTMLEGGLMATGVSGGTSFTIEPGQSNSIIDSYSEGVSIRDTINIIVGITIDRESRDTYVINHVANNNRLMHKKVALYREAALGSLPALRLQLRRIGDRAFHPIDSTNITVAGVHNVKAFGTMSVEGKTFRIFGYTKNYDASSNSVTMSIEGRWGA